MPFTSSKIRVNVTNALNSISRITRWVTLGSVTGNNLVKRAVSFSAFTTNKIRVNVTNANSVSRITEVEAFGW